MRNVAGIRDTRWLPFAFLLTLVLPSAIYMVFATSSMAAGTLICDMGWIGIALASCSTGIRWSTGDWRQLGALLLVLVLLFMHGVVIDLWIGGVDFTRLTGSCLVLFVMAIGADVIALRLLAVSARALRSMALFAFAVLTVVGFAAVAGFPAVSHAFQKPVVVFSEPSVFSFAYLPVLLFAVSTTTRGRQFIYLMFGFGLAVALQNLTLLVGVLGVSCLILGRGQLLLLSALILGALATLAVDLTYFASRLDLSGDSDNLSTLVYLQGWERAEINISETDGLGVGFQQFGVVGSRGTILDKIAAFTQGETLNLYDGGSTGSKLIAELGAIGVLLILLYFRLVARGVALIRQMQRVPIRQRDIRRIFFYSILLAYTSEVLLRGNGYLSSSGTFVLASIIALHRLESADRRVSANSRSRSGFMQART